MTIFISADKNRNVFGWIILAIFITPILTTLLLLGMNKKLSEDEQKSIVDAAKHTITAGGVSISSEIENLHNLLTKGVITEEEFKTQKAKLLK